MTTAPNALLVLLLSVLSSPLAAQDREPEDPPGLPLGLAKFVDPLPPLPRIAVRGPCPCTLTLSAGAFTTKLHRDLPPVTTWGYEGSSPGPLIEVESGSRLTVRWKNQLPATHLFPLPTGVMAMQPDVRTVTHLHGAAVAEPTPMDVAVNSDGWPDAFYGTGGEQLAHYPNRQSARLLWYHDHAMATTGRNVAAGLFGPYVIRDRYERSLHLPQGAFEVPLVISSRQLTNAGGLAYTKDIGSEFYGNVAPVNGKLWPVLAVEPRRYRLRILDAANARTFALSLMELGTNAPGPAFYQIGGDGGFLPKVAVLNDPTTKNAPALTLMPAERADVIIDFSAVAGRDFVLHNSAAPAGDREYPIPELMLFHVGLPSSGRDVSRVPRHLRSIPRLAVQDASVTRRIVFDQMPMPNGETMMTLNGKGWTDPVEEKPRLGTSEVWELVNLLPDTHPFHIHLTTFQVMERLPFDVAAYRSTGQIVATGAPAPPAVNETGWKDTVPVPPGMVTRIIMRFAPFAGSYVYHCHILEHEDMEMMRPFIVVDP